MNPLLILAIGIISILGLILVFRVNAFLALIISAIIVSLLAPGPWQDKISRVAVQFGVGAGNIGIVIGLAAIIGECMMASGAADRIVQSFLKVLGEKRASWALMGSGFVLAVPVFFDTVFYLLVPLARSLFRRTNANYLLYVLAISAGGAITHTLVPPTPGPLVMATTLGIDIGVMILVGAIVAFPAAVAGLVFSAWLNKRMNIPFRDDHVVGTEDDVPAVPTSTPPLWLSLLPVVLPVLMISANTALETMANAEHTPKLQVQDVTDWNAFQSALNDGANSPAVARIVASLPDPLQQSIQNEPLTDASKQDIVNALNAALISKTPLLYDNAAFDTVLPKSWKIVEELARPDVSDERKAELSRLALVGTLAQGEISKMKAYDLERFNRLLLEVTFPGTITPHTWETPLRNAANISNLFGNANFALLISTIVAMWIMYRQKGSTLTALSEMAELALMSGGTIILITAAGYAFGKMLDAAQVGAAIQAQFKDQAGDSGFAFLVLGYSIAVLLKVAQGSSTTAMIVGSGMLASMIAGVNLGFHPVYLATAIGAGSLMGSWMNDSGFWIFAKMGRLTESESLRSWTPLLAVLSLVSFATTVLLTKILPLVATT